MLSCSVGNIGEKSVLGTLM